MNKLLIFLLLSTPALATVPLTLVVSPHGSGLTDTGSSTITLTAACTYSVAPFADNCAAAGTITWVSHGLTDTGGANTAAASVNSGGVVTWLSTVNSTNYIHGTFMATSNITATVAGACNGSPNVCTDFAVVQGQHNGDSWQILVTPAVNLFQSPISGISPPLTVPINASVQIGAGYNLNGGGSGNPTQVCNWSSSNGNFTIDRDGRATAAATSGTSVETCNLSGNALVTGTVTSITLTAINPTPSPQTWYVRSDGGTPYNATDNPSGTCDGLGDAPVSGGTPNQHCAYGDYEYLYFDNHTHFKQQWVIAGGDTVIVRKPTGGATYHAAVISVGSFIPTNCSDVGPPGTQACPVPWPPSGTVANPTKILGENFANCSDPSGYGPDATKVTPITFYGRDAVSFQLSQNVNFECIDIQPDTNFQGNFGIWQSALTANVNIKNVSVQNSLQGVFGATGQGNTFDHFLLHAASNFGINMDDAPYGESNFSAAGDLTMTNSILEYTGCFGLSAGSCYDHPANSGDPDAISSGNTVGNVSLDKVIIRYSFEDGFDLLHSLLKNVSITNSQFYGNVGQQLKIGPSINLTVRNNTVIGNCNRVLYPIGGISLAHSGTTPCRAGGAPVNPVLAGSGVNIFQNNTFIGIGNPTVLQGCAYGWGCFDAALNLTWQDNIILGYTGNNYSSGGTANAFGTTNINTIFDHNSYYNVNNTGTLGTGDITTDPLLAGEVAAPPLTPFVNATEVALDGFDFNPTASSTVKWTGVAYTGQLATAQNGVTWHVPPSMGAFEFLSGTVEIILRGVTMKGVIVR